MILLMTEQGAVLGIHIDLAQPPGGVQDLELVDPAPTLAVELRLQNPAGKTGACALGHLHEGEYLAPLPRLAGPIVIVLIVRPLHRASGGFPVLGWVLVASHGVRRDEGKAQGEHQVRA